MVLLNNSKQLGLSIVNKVRKNISFYGSFSKEQKKLITAYLKNSLFKRTRGADFFVRKAGRFEIICVTDSNNTILDEFYFSEIKKENVA